MNVLDKMNSLGVFGERAFNKSEAKSYFFQHRIYIYDCLENDDFDDDFKILVDRFLDSDYIGECETQEWDKFLEMECK